MSGTTVPGLVDDIEGQDLDHDIGFRVGGGLGEALLHRSLVEQRGRLQPFDPGTIGPEEDDDAVAETVGGDDLRHENHPECNAGAILASGGGARSLARVIGYFTEPRELFL